MTDTFEAPLAWEKALISGDYSDLYSDEAVTVSRISEALSAAGWRIVARSPDSFVDRYGTMFRELTIYHCARET